MNSESKFGYEFCLIGNDFSPDGRAKPCVYQNIIQNVAERHLLSLGLETDKLATQNLAFVLVGMTIEIINAPSVSDFITGKTWHSETKGPFFRREFSFFSSEGMPVFCGAGYSVLIDLTKRSVLRSFALPAVVSTGSGEFAVSNASPTIRDISEYEFCETRKIYPSFLDILGHVNNTRYCDFAYDTLTPEENAKPLKRIEISFSGELTGSDSADIYKGYCGDKVYIKGIRHSDQKKSFSVIFSY